MPRLMINIRAQVEHLPKDKIIIGHALTHDLNILQLSAPDHMIRDTSKYHGFRKYANVKNNTPGLQTLAEKVSGIEIQT